MAVYDSSAFDAIDGTINFPGGTFFVMLVTAAYVPNLQTNSTRADVTNECVGAGYVAGGAVTLQAVARNVPARQTNITFGDVTFSATTVTNVAAAIVYQHNGGAPAGDPLVAYVPLTGAPINPGGTDLVVGFSTPYTYQVL